MFYIITDGVAGRVIEVDTPITYDTETEYRNKFAFEQDIKNPDWINIQIIPVEKTNDMLYVYTYGFIDEQHAVMYSFDDEYFDELLDTLQNTYDDVVVYSLKLVK